MSVPAAFFYLRNFQKMEDKPYGRKKEISNQGAR